MHGACKCNVGYSGDCCEYTENTKKDTDTDTNTGSIKIKVAISVPGVVVLFVIIFCVRWRYFKEWTQTSKINMNLPKVAFFTFLHNILSVKLKTQQAR